MVAAVIAVCVVALCAGSARGAPDHVILQEQHAQDEQGMNNNTNYYKKHGVCCIQEELEADNLIESLGQTYDADGQIILDDSMVPGLMNRDHVEYRPLHKLTRKPTIKGPNWPVRDNNPLFPAHPTLPYDPTHPPSITNQPWWNPTPGPSTRPPWEQTTKHPISVISTTTSYWWQPPTTSITTTRAPPTPTTTSPWWQPSTISITPPTPAAAGSFGNENPCAAHSFDWDNDDEKQALWESFLPLQGFPSRKHSHPWLATLFNGTKQFCGGSLIDKTHILTAAQCIAHMSSADVSRLKVRLGAHNIHHRETTTQEFNVSKVVRHKDYDAMKLYNDVAMLTLDQPAQFNQYVRPICLASGGNWVDVNATVAGWGSLSEGGPQPGALHELKFRVWSLTRCGQYYGTAAPGGIVESYICAGDGGKDSCRGDLGGPLVIKTNGVWTQIGIVSWVIGCGKGNYPGVYSRLPSFLDWINRVKAIYR